MNRETILKEFKVDANSVIHRLGQFEGEMIYVPYFWEIYLDGGADRDDGEVLGFDLTAEDKLQFPELGRKRTIKLSQTDQGFVIELK